MKTRQPARRHFKPHPRGLRARKLILKSSLSPGDVVMLTAAVRDLHACYPRLFQTDVRTPCPSLWEHNPFLTPLIEGDPGVELIHCHYPLIDRCDRTPYHCLHGYMEFLNDRLGLAIRPTAFRGDIHLSEEERSWYSQVRELTHGDVPFWIIVAGGKLDYTIKWWDVSRYQEVVDHFRNRIQFVQVGDKGHYHPRLKGVIDLRGETDLRQLVRLVYHAQGVLCPVTSLMHLAAAVEVKPGMPPHRPCVVVGGGREPYHWEAYPQHQFIHTIGALQCCADGGCWRSRTRPLGDNSEHDRPDALCKDTRGDLPRCMDMIQASEVICSIERYFVGGAIKYLSTREANRAALAVRKTSTNSFDETLNLVTAEPAARAFISGLTSPPAVFRGQGIVICGGGVKYIPGLWVAVNRLRKLGCTLPIQAWHLDQEPVDESVRALAAPLGVEWVNAGEVRKLHPARLLGGWELKPYALLHCPFEEVLLLDADNVPVRNPEYLFQIPEFKATGAVLWPDQEVLDTNHPRWELFRVTPQLDREVESGQVLLNKTRCWKPLMLCCWYNDHSDFYYRATNGDKGTFHIAFRKLNQAFSMPPKRPQLMLSGLQQHDFEGRPLFQHRCFDKWTLFRRPRADPQFLEEDQCFQWLNSLRSHWNLDQKRFHLLAPPKGFRVAMSNSHFRKAARQITLLTLYNPDFYELAAITTSRMREYARTHSYRFLQFRNLLDPKRSPAWNKILAVREALRTAHTRWVLWLDADSVILNFNCRIEDLLRPEYDLIFGSDFNGLNSSAFLVRNSIWSIRFLDAVYYLGEVDYELDRFGPKWEQNTIKHVLHNFAGFKDHVAMHPERCMNALPGTYQHGDFILHLGGMSMSERLAILKHRQLA